MEKIRLESYKGVIILSILTLLLGCMLLYWGLSGSFSLKISGAKLDRETSSVLLCLISIAPFISSINYLIKYISIFKYGEFVIVLSNTSVTYPESHFFGGFKKVTINKNQIKFVELQRIDRHKYQINLKNENNMTIGRIAGELLHRKTLTAQQGAEKINLWLNS